MNHKNYYCHTETSPFVKEMKVKYRTKELKIKGKETKNDACGNISGKDQDREVGQD